ncbi:hypothetical protein [Bosea sp. ASV33]|uniref:hypothetical protein n=1 Tax=Bosea sp. ASV33 TaxID=2795106 RepID=UPI0018EAE46F|nr:hypothetical protein [Bosea sp. ASV33]
MIEPLDKRNEIGWPLRQELKFWLGWITRGQCLARGRATAHPGMGLRLVVITARNSVAARRAMRQGETAIECDRIGISARGQPCENRLNHEQIGRENRDP